MAYIGQSIKNGTFSVLDTSGNTYNSSNVTFNLGTQVGSPAQLLVSKNGVIQKAGTDYTLASGGTQITFTTAPASGDNIFIVEISGAVGGPMNRDINGDELILDVDGDTSITADTDDQIDIKIGGADDFAFKANKFEVQTGSNVDMNGTELILDADGDTSITADTDDQIDFKVGGSDTYTMTSDTFTAKNNITALSTNTTANIRVQNSTTGSNSNDGLLIQATGNDVYINNYENADMYFRTNNSDRIKITNGGDVLVGTTSGTINASNFGHKLESGGTLRTSANSGSGATVAEHFGNAGQFRVMGDGDAENTNNNYGALSDRTLKENETSANSQWDDIKALQIKNYNLIEYPDRPHLGVIAQDLESAGMTGLVKTDSDGLKSVKYSVLYMKAVKALQEAMTKIETLETEMTALKARVTTLEG